MNYSNKMFLKTKTSAQMFRLPHAWGIKFSLRAVYDEINNKRINRRTSKKSESVHEIDLFCN